MPLTAREKICHLYRRFGFGATIAEVDEGVKNGFEVTLKGLIDYETVPAKFNIHPYEFCWNEKEDAEPGAYRFRSWWILAMACTGRPLQEKLALFWHSHFAVSDAKVEHGPMMLDYLQTLRKGANGRFPELLKAVSQSPAMMRYLDMELAIRGRPNENFAREVMELFTMGIGNYTEKDVQECARALTGWGLMDLFYSAGPTQSDRVKTILRDRRPAVAFCEMPTMRDDGPKTILGKTADFDGEKVLDMLALQPATATFISKKLWEFFAYENPEASVIERLSSVFLKSKGDIKQMLYAIARSPEFWSERCVKKLIKSPADYVVGMCRVMGVGATVLQLREKGATAETRLPEQIHGEAGTMAYFMLKMGLDVLYPPDVSGWKWGSAWISPASMAMRMQYHGQRIWDSKGPASSTKIVLEQMQPAVGKSSKEIALRFCEVFDLRLDDLAFKQVEAHFEKSGGKECLANENNWAGAMYHALKMLSAAPATHLC